MSMPQADTPQAPSAAFEGSDKRTHVRWTIFAVIFFLVVINMIDRVSLSIAMPTIGKEFGLNQTMQGVILSSFFWAYALLQIPGGWLADRIGPRKMVTASTVLWGLFQAMAAFATGGLSLLAARFMLGAAEAPIFPAGAKLNANWLSKQERSRGAVLMDCGGPLGVAIGGALISYLILAMDSWRMAFFIAGAATVLAGVAAWFHVRDFPHEHKSVNRQELEHIRAGAAVRDGADGVDEPSAFIPGQSLAGIVIGRAAWAMMFFGLLTWGPSYLAQARGFDLKGIGASTFIIFSMGSLGCLTSGFLADILIGKGYSRAAVYKGLLSLSGLATMVAFATLPSISDPLSAVVLLAFTAFILMWGGLYWSFPVLLAPKSRVGIVGGIMNMAGSTGGICIPIIVGFILDMTGESYMTVLYFFAGCAAVFILGTCMINLRNIRA